MSISLSALQTNATSVQNYSGVLVTGSNVTLSSSSPQDIVISGHTGTYRRVVNYTEISGSLISWVNRIDGSNSDTARSVSATTDGSVYATGVCNSTTGLYGTNGGLLATLGNLGSFATYIAKYASNGSLLFTNRIDGTASDEGNSVSASSDGGVYVTGYSSSTQASFFATNGTTILATLGNLGRNPIYIAKYASNGSLLWTNRIDADYYGQSVSASSDGGVFTTGYYTSTQASFYATNGTTIQATLGNLSTAGTSAIYIAKYNSAGALLFTNRIDGTRDESGTSLSATTDGSVYATGYYTSTAANFYATNGTTVLATLGNFNTQGTIYIAKYNSAGALLWTNRIDGSGNDQGQSVSASRDGGVFATGYYLSTTASFYATNGTTVSATLGNLGSNAIFIAKYDSAGALLWTNRIDGTNDDQGFSVSASIDGGVYATGYYLSTQANFYATNGTTILSTLGNLGNRAIYIAKYDSAGALLFTNRIDGTLDDYGVSVSASSDGGVYATGYYTSTQANFYATNGTTILATLGNITTGTTTIYIAKYGSGFTTSASVTTSAQTIVTVPPTGMVAGKSYTIANNGPVSGYTKDTGAIYVATTSGNTIARLLKGDSATITPLTSTPTTPNDLYTTISRASNNYGPPTVWTTRASAANNQWYSVTWAAELGLFCAVSQSGTGNRVMTSPDGITWTTRTSAANNTWTSVIWASELGLFCAVSASGTGNRVMTSPNGIDWTTRASAFDNDWWSIAWSPELSIFCAVALTGTGNRVMTSPDGIVWTTRASAADNNWRSVTWAPELGIFCAVARTGTGNRVMTSPDGITWTTRASAIDNDWVGVTWAAELGIFCAIAVTGTGNGVMTSPDGITWTTRASAADNSWFNVVWASELSLFCAVAVTGTGNRVMTSPDGITWTIRATTVDIEWRGVTWAPELGLFCAVSSSGTGNRVMTSGKE
uniref:Bulb-type lectin domain-containing protein n=1 Tax=viral metagenome TaxID=1070528 RepID=A0A6C0E0F4_9ZZZZ